MAVAVLEAADNQWGYGLSDRVDLLARNLRSRPKHSLTTVVGAMNAAAPSIARRSCAAGSAGPRPAAPFPVRYCGAGNAANCRPALWAAIDAAGNDLAATQGPNPAAWRADATKERIMLRYTNRPGGIQQVVSFRGHRAAR